MSFCWRFRYYSKFSHCLDSQNDRRSTLWVEWSLVIQLQTRQTRPRLRMVNGCPHQSVRMKLHFAININCKSIIVVQLGAAMRRSNSDTNHMMDDIKARSTTQRHDASVDCRPTFCSVPSLISRDCSHRPHNVIWYPTISYAFRNERRDPDRETF